MRKILPAALASATLAVLMLVAPTLAPAQAGDQDAAKNAAQARAALDAMVQALGGELWLNINNMERHGHVAAFFQGNPDPGTTEYFEFHQWPDHDRIEYTSIATSCSFMSADRQGRSLTAARSHWTRILSRTICAAATIPLRQP